MIFRRLLFVVISAFVVLLLPAPEAFAGGGAVSYYSLSGTVTLAVDGSPVSDMRVVAYGADTAKKISFYHSTYTDERGRYRFDSINDLCSYNVQILPEYDTLLDGTILAQYPTQFYDRSSTFHGAKLLKLTSDTTGIDFPLTKRVIHRNGVTGVLRDWAGKPVEGRVTLTPISTIYRGYVPRRAVAGPDGAFGFSDLAPGTWIVFGDPADRGTAAGYYDMNGPAATIWLDATLVTVGPEGTVSGLEIRCPERKVAGSARISGTVVWSPTGVVSPGYSVHEHMPVEGARITVLLEGRVADRAVTDLQGKFELKEVPSGPVTLVVDKPGYRVHRIDTVLDDGGRLSLRLWVGSGLSDVEMESIPVEAISIYPNPIVSTSLLQLHRSGRGGRAGIMLTDLTGRTVLTFDTEDDMVELSAADLPGGVYYLRVRTAASVASFPIVVSR